jgi:Protein of unknown function (DUF3187)
VTHESPVARALLMLGIGAGLGPTSLPAQSLPILHPINPVAEARSGLYFQPLVPAGKGWHTALGVDYGNILELNFRTSLADTSYLLDAEVLRLNLSATHDLGPNTFVSGEVALGGSYNGFLDGFLDWYHGLFGIEIPSREDRPRNSYAYQYKFRDNRVVRFDRHGAYLGDVRIGIGYRYNPRTQSVLSLTLPTNTAGDGYGRGTVSISLLNTFRSGLTPRLVYEGSLNTGLTPKHGALRSAENSAFFLGTSGIRWRSFGGLWSFGNLYLHSPYYSGTGATQLDRWDLTIDFGWIIRGKSGREFRFGMTEDLWPSGPAVDANFRVGYAW